MRVLVAGATSALGLPTVRELVRRGHDVHGLTRTDAGAATIAANRATPAIGDVHDRETMLATLERLRPDAVASLLIALPRYGPSRLRDFHQTVRLWRHGVPNLLEAAATVGVDRVVAESVIFSYGYTRHDRGRIGETDEVDPSATPGDGAWLLEALHQMERQVLQDERFAGAVLRYGLFHGPSVTSTRLLVDLMRRRLPVIPGGGRGVTSWIELTDAARATAEALETADAGEVYNVVDDRPVTFTEHATAFAHALGLPRPRHLPSWVARVLAPYTKIILDEVRLPVDNTKAKRTFGWAPRFPTVYDTARLFAWELGGTR